MHMSSSASKPVRFLSGSGASNAPNPDRVEALPRAERAAALRHAIPLAAPGEVPGFILTLLEAASAPGTANPRGGNVVDRLRAFVSAPAWRAADDALVALACVWKRVPSDLKGAALAAGRGRWTETIACAAASDDAFERESAAILIRDSSNAANAPEARRLLADADRDVARAADRALLSLAVRVAGFDATRLGPDLAFVSVPSYVDPAPAEVVIAEVAEAAWTFGDEHRGRDTLAAALLLADLVSPPARLSQPQRRLDALLTTPDHPAVGALRTIVRTSRSPELRARCLRWAAAGPLADGALERLSKADSDEDHAAVLELAHLVRRPARETALSAVPVRLARDGVRLAKGGLVPDASAWARLSPEARRGYALLGAELRLAPAVRRAVFATCLGDPDVIARHRAVRACELQDAADFMFDPDPRIARTAALRWSGAGLAQTVRVPKHSGDERRARMLGKLARSPHRAVRAIASADDQRLMPWSHEDASSRVAARRWLTEDAPAFQDAARRRLAASDDRVVVQTVQVLIALNTATVFERELTALLAQTDRPRVAATAARALGSIRTTSARTALTNALRARDARLRANTVESLARTSKEAVGVLVEFKNDPHHRVRGAAVRAEIGLRGDACLADVRAMLDDARWEHRLAGVWVAERALTGRRGVQAPPTVAGILDRLSEIARDDVSGAVRARAVRCVRRVLLECDSPPGLRAASQIEPAPPASLEVSA